MWRPGKSAHVRRRAREHHDMARLGRERGAKAAAIMAWVDGLTPEQRDAVDAHGEQPVRIAMGLGYRHGPAFVREVREAAERIHERAMARAVGDGDN